MSFSISVSSNIAKIGPKYKTSIDKNRRQFSTNIISHAHKI